MIEKKTWEEFKNSGFLWWINSLLHVFGWAIVIESDYGTILNVYPARVKFRGFDEKTNELGYQRISKYMADNAEQLEKESNS